MKTGKLVEFQEELNLNLGLKLCDRSVKQISEIS